MKRKLSAIIAMALLCTVTACGTNTETETTKTILEGFQAEGYPIIDEKYTLTVAASVPEGTIDQNQIQVWKDLEEKTNVHIEWVTVPASSWDEKKNLMFASGDLPDVFLGNWVLSDKDLLTYGDEGLILPLEDLIDEYSVYLKKDLEEHPEIKNKALTNDNHLYGTPIYEEGPLCSTTQSAFYINKTWLDNLNLQVPTTTEEFYNVLKAFKEQDPNGNGQADEIPFTFSKTVVDMFGPFGYIDNQDHLVVKDGKVVFMAEEDEYKQAVQYMNKLFSEGLVDQEAFTQTSAIYNAKLKNPVRTVGAFFAWRDSAWQLSEDDDEYIAIPPLKGPEGYQYASPRGNGFKGRCGVVITSACENPEVAMRWADELYNPESNIAAYVMDYNIKLNSNNKLEFIQKTTEEDKKNLPTNYLYNQLEGKGYDWEVLPQMRVQKEKLDKIYEPYLPPHEPVVTSGFTLDDYRSLATIQTDINSFVDESVARWMMYGGIEQEWDNYVKKLYDMRLEELKEIYQRSYDEYIKK